VDAALASVEVAALLEQHPRGVVVDAVRAALADRRAREAGPDGLAADVHAALVPSLRRVINATGVVLHTNLGRAPLADEAVRAAVGVAGYSTLEWDPETGERGSRHSHVVDHLRALTGAEDACVVNTNAGAVLLALVALASGREVVVSRGQLVEIGGGFRIPEVLEASGCRLVEVGTTNRTRIADYAAGCGPETAVLLRVHPSNFRVMGFTEEASLQDLVALARERGLVVVDDLGSGALSGDAAYRGEPHVRDAVAAGADVVCFSGDKLMGGPQAGIVVGTAVAVARVRSHALMRALRPDKLTLAALGATLALHRDPDRARALIPALRMLGSDTDELRQRAEDLAGKVDGEVVSTVARVGGGALPLEELPSYAVALDDERGAGALVAALRRCAVPVVARVHEGRVLLDVITLSDADLHELPGLVAATR
jgi:L-seryl-tRNA(Ser) seleniumtransferase